VQAWASPYHSSSSSFQHFYVITLYFQQEDRKTPMHWVLALTERQKERERERSVSPKEQINQRNGTAVKYVFLKSKFTKKYFSPSSPMPLHILEPCAAVPA
jgi:hypothetical protein